MNNNGFGKGPGNKKVNREYVISMVILVILVGIVLVFFLKSEYERYNKQPERSAYETRKECMVSGCHERRVSDEGALYCSRHTCNYPGCLSLALGSTGYCYFHDPAKATTEKPAAAPKPPAGSRKNPGTKNPEEKDDPYNMTQYFDYEDFYDDWFDDFDGLDDAEMYWDDYYMD